MEKSARLLLASASAGVLVAIIAFLTLDGMWTDDGRSRPQQNFHSDDSSSNNSNNAVTQQLQKLQQLSHMQRQQLQEAHKQLNETQQQLQKTEQLQKEQQQLENTQQQLQKAQQQLQKTQQDLQETQQQLQEAQQKLRGGKEMQKELTKQLVTTEGQQLHQQKQVRVLVWVLTQPSSHAKKAVHVRDTWGKRVDKLLFISTADDLSLPAVNVHVTEGYNFLWLKTRAAFKYVYEKHLQDADWFMKADDDTFVVVENLRYMLSMYNPDTPIYFGSRFKHFTKQGYMSGGGGYVLSKAAVKLFVEKALDNDTLCKQRPTWAEDAEMGICLYNVGVKAGDSRDNLGRGRFFPFVPEQHLVSHSIGKKFWYWDYIYYPIKVGPECCSDTAITFHYISPDKMQELNYLLYHLRPHGVHRHDPDPPKLPPDYKSVPKEVLEKYSNGTATKA